VSREDEIQDEPPFKFEDVWPDDKPFPLCDAECARLVRGRAWRLVGRASGKRNSWWAGRSCRARRGTPSTIDCRRCYSGVFKHELKT
jgi:hypothetical protein